MECTPCYYQQAVINNTINSVKTGSPWKSSENTIKVSRKNAKGTKHITAPTLLAQRLNMREPVTTFTACVH